MNDCCFSSSGCFLLFAHFDGYLSIQKLHHASRNIEQIWSSKVHTLGCKINLTFDLSNCFFISAGQDGNLFVFQVSNDLFKDAEKFQVVLHYLFYINMIWFTLKFYYADQTDQIIIHMNLCFYIRFCQAKFKRMLIRNKYIKRN